MARRGSPARLVIALSIAAVLAVFLLYTSIAGGGTPSLTPGQLAGRTDEVTVAGRVVGSVSGDAYGDGLRFRVRDIKGARKATVTVVYTGSVPDMFRVGRDVAITGRMQNGVFVSTPGTMITKCPSKYTASQTAN